MLWGQVLQWLLGTRFHVHLYDCFRNSLLWIWLKCKSLGVQTVNRKENLMVYSKALKKSYIVRDSKMGTNLWLLKPELI